MTEETIPERKRVMPENPAAITALSAILSEDQRRIKVIVELDDGSTRPDLELILLNHRGQEISRTTIIENLGPRLAFNMYLRSLDPEFPLLLRCNLNYLDDKVDSQKELKIEK